MRAIKLAIILSLSFLTGIITACSAASASKTVNAPLTASSTVNTVSQSSTVSAKSTSASESTVSAVAGVVPKTFKAKKVTRTVGSRQYSVYIPENWKYNYNGVYFIDTKTGERYIAGFDPLSYANVHTMQDYLGNHGELIAKEENLPDMKNKTTKLIIKFTHAACQQAAGDNTVDYYLQYYILSSDGKTNNSLYFHANNINEIPGNDEKAVLQKIYENTGLNDEMVQEILHSYSET